MWTLSLHVQISGGAFHEKRRQRAQVHIIWGPAVILENRALSYLQDELWYQQGLQSYTLLERPLPYGPSGDEYSLK